MSDGLLDCKVRVGNEFDESVWAALRSALQELGFVVESEEWGVGGSQELITIQASLGEKTLTIEAETYLGISVAGEAGVVSEVAALVAERLKSIRNS